MLIDAQWIHRPASAPVPASDLVWAVASDPDTLRAWALAWDDGDGNADLFRPELPDDPAVFVLAGLSTDGRVAASAVASCSHQVVGISNVFALDGGPDAARPVVLDAVNRLFPTLPVVGYEQGDDLAAAILHGFAPVGPLRFWLGAHCPAVRRSEKERLINIKQDHLIQDGVILRRFSASFSGA